MTQSMECLNANMCSDCMDKVHQAAFKIANQIPPHGRRCLDYAGGIKHRI